MTLKYNNRPVINKLAVLVDQAAKLVLIIEKLFSFELLLELVFCLKTLD